MTGSLGATSPFPPDPYAAFREAGALDAQVGQLRFTLAVGYDEVRRRARDWRTFTSDTPFEVPIPHEHDVRSVRQLPVVAVAHIPGALPWMREDPVHVRRAVEEVLRMQAPLPFIGRHATTAAAVGAVEVEPGDLVALGLAAANRDPAAFDDADRCRLDRWPDRHIAFGHGPHTCLGAALARMEVRVVLEQLAVLADGVEYVEPSRLRAVDLGGAAVTTFVGGRARLLPRQDGHHP